jgi:hypothetical protein
MDKNYISALEDTNTSLSKRIANIEKKILDFNLSTASSQKNILSKIKIEFESMKADLGLMKMDIMNLQESENQKVWKEKYSNFKSQKVRLEKKINELKIKEKDKKSNDEEDYMDIDKKVDLGKLSSAQAIKRGDKILDKDHESLQKMAKIMSKDINTMKETNKELYRQMEAMDKIEGDLNEIDGSLNRVKKMVNYMSK